MISIACMLQLLREQIARNRVGATDEGMNTRHFPAHERQDLVKQLETSREQVRFLKQLQFFLVLAIDQSNPSLRI